MKNPASATSVHSKAAAEIFLVMPTFNNAEFLGEAMASALASKFPFGASLFAHRRLAQLTIPLAMPLV